MKVPEREMRENETEDIFKGIITENFPDLMENTNLSIHSRNSTNLQKDN